MIGLIFRGTDRKEDAVHFKEEESAEGLEKAQKSEVEKRCTGY